MQNLTVKIKRLPHYPKEWDLPKYGSEHAACFDLRAIVEDDHGCGVYHDVAHRIKTGLAFEIPEGYVMLLKPRSGLAFKYAVSSFEGTIDSDYRGEVQVLLYMLESHSEFEEIYHGDRIAQAMIIPVPRVTWEEVEELSETARGDSGFGSTGR